jgi:hypothetical protein
MFFLHWSMGDARSSSQVPLKEQVVDAWIEHFKTHPVEGIKHQKVWAGISAEGLEEIISVCGGREAVKGKPLLEVFQTYWDITAYEEPVSDLTRTVRDLLGKLN